MNIQSPGALRGWMRIDAFLSLSRTCAAIS
jgi:hypothetical protein